MCQTDEKSNTIVESVRETVAAVLIPSNIWVDCSASPCNICTTISAVLRKLFLHLAATSIPISSLRRGFTYEGKVHDGKVE